MTIKGKIFENQTIEFNAEIIKDLNEVQHDYTFSDAEESSTNSLLEEVKNILGSLNFELDNKIYEIPVIVKLMKLKKVSDSYPESYRKRLIILWDRIKEKDRELISKVRESTIDFKAVSNKDEFDQVNDQVILNFISYRSA